MKDPFDSNTDDVAVLGHGIQILFAFCPTLSLVVGVRHNPSQSDMFTRTAGDSLWSGAHMLDGPDVYEHRFWIAPEGPELDHWTHDSSGICSLTAYHNDVWTQNAGERFVRQCLRHPDPLAATSASADGDDLT